MNIPEEARLTDEELVDIETVHAFYSYLKMSDLRTITDAQLLKAAPIIEAQARKEVIEWIESESGLDVDDETLEPNGRRSFWEDEWQKKLKEWGGAFKRDG